MAVGKLPARSCLIDGEAIVCDENGLAIFELIRRHGALASAVHCAFDLLELDGKDLRREPIEERKRLLAKLLRGSNLSIVLNEHFEEDGESSSASRFTAGALGFLTFTQCADRPQPIGRAKPLRHDPFAAELAGFAELGALSRLSLNRRHIVQFGANMIAIIFPDF
jgi:bifunctional non-homologous end joining protein LigD